MTPYAIACGIAVRPTVRPATKSSSKKFALYLGNQLMTGKTPFTESGLQHFLALFVTAAQTLGKSSR